MKILTNATNSNFLPNAIANSVTAIDFKYWQRQGVKVICLDLDSTLLPHGGVELDAAALRALQDQPLPITIATNRLSASGVRKIVRELDTADIQTAKSWWTKKPSTTYFSELINTSGHSADELLMVGDRLIQDMWGANRAGLQTLMVEKLGHQPWREKLFGAVDRWFIHHVADRYHKSK